MSDLTKFHTNYYNRPVSKGEVISKLDVVERVGYVPIQKQIQILFQTGRLNEMFKASQFQLSDVYDIDDVEVDPTTRKSFDFAEAFGYSEYFKSKFIEANQIKNSVKEALNNVPETETIPETETPEENSSGE